jgi:hypothetical protein
MGTSSRCRILAATASTLDTSLAPGSGTLDAANAVETSSTRLAVDAVRTSDRRVRSGMICIFSNYRLRIKKIQYHASLVKYRFLRSYSAKSRIYVVFHEFYDHLTCLYLCLGGFRTHSMTPRREKRSPKQCSTQAVEGRSTMTQRSDEQCILGLVMFGF